MEGELKMDCKGCARELTIIEEIDALPIEERIKERIKSKISKLNSKYNNITDELHERLCEIERLEKAVIYLSKLVGEYKEIK